MTFLELQNKIIQSRKARRGISNRRDYFSNIKIEDELTLKEIYKKALRAANDVIKHYETGEFDPKEKISVTFGEKKPNKKENPNKSLEALEKENEKLKAEVTSLKKEIESFKGKFCHGGRKGYDATMAEQVKSARANDETWRGLSARLGISTATAQKLYRAKTKNH